MAAETAAANQVLCAMARVASHGRVGILLVSRFCRVVRLGARPGLPLPLKPFSNEVYPITFFASCVTALGFRGNQVRSDVVWRVMAVFIPDAV